MKILISILVLVPMYLCGAEGRRFVDWGDFSSGAPKLVVTSDASHLCIISKGTIQIWSLSEDLSKQHRVYDEEGERQVNDVIPLDGGFVFAFSNSVPGSVAEERDVDKGNTLCFWNKESNALNSIVSFEGKILGIFSVSRDEFLIATYDESNDSIILEFWDAAGVRLERKEVLTDLVINRIIGADAVRGVYFVVQPPEAPLNTEFTDYPENRVIAYLGGDVLKICSSKNQLLYLAGTSPFRGGAGLAPIVLNDREILVAHFLDVVKGQAHFAYFKHGHLEKIIPSPFFDRQFTAFRPLRISPNGESVLIQAKTGKSAFAIGVLTLSNFEIAELLDLPYLHEIWNWIEKGVPVTFNKEPSSWHSGFLRLRGTTGSSGKDY